VRRSLWGLRDPLKRYSRLIGIDVLPMRGETPLDTMQRYDLKYVARPDAIVEGIMAHKVGITVEHPWLDPALSGYIAGLPASVRYPKKARPLDALR